MPRLPPYWPIIAVFVAMTILQASVAALSIQLLSTVRAYVAGESLYSKAQKDAQIYLLDYTESHREADYLRFEAALAIPLGDRAAREALQRAVPDIEAAREGFLDGGNDPDDIAGLIRMFRWFQRVPFMSTPIATWTEGDRTIQEMRALVEQAHERIRAGDPQSPAVLAMLRQSPSLNARLTRLTSAFSAQLGAASRTTQRLLLGLNTCIAVLLMVSGLGFVRRAIRMQAASDLRMERLIHAVTDGVVSVDEDRRVVLFNQAAEMMFGVEAIHALGSPIDRFVEHLAIASESQTAATQPGAPGAGSLQALTGRKRDGRAFPIEASLSRLHLARGTLTTIVLRDITARIVADAERRAHESLEASSKAKTEFLSRMSHELRTPLNAVIGFSQLLRLDTSRPLSTEQLTRVQHVENAGSHLLALVNDVLDLSRIESGEMAIASQAVALVRVIEEAATMVSPLVTKAGIEVFLAAEPPAGQLPGAGFAQPAEVWVNADPVRLRQVLVNLLSNAVKYNRPGGRVALTWKHSKHQCEILVTDTGQGIPADQLAGLFQPFNRLGAESTTVEGTGIGLVLSRQLAEMMGGTLTVTSTFGVGTCATLRLGVTHAPAAGPAPSHKVRSAARARSALSVLYAEDDEVNAELIRQLSAMRGDVSLRVAANGAMALASARADPPDLMLVDMNLGDMTGIELARELRRDRATRDVHLVALSADALPEQIRATMACGFESYLTKPIKFDEVLSVFDRYSETAAA